MVVAVAIVVVVAVTSRVVVAIAVMVVMAMAIELASGVPLLFSTHVRGRAGRRSLVPGRWSAVQSLGMAVTLVYFCLTSRTIEFL